MKIEHIQFGFSIENGGPTRSLANYCRGQVAAGHEVSVWTLEGFPNFSPAVRLPPPVEMHVFRVEWPVKLGRSAEMRRQLRLAEPPDIYHLHGVWLQAVHYGAVEACRRNRPYVLEMQGMYDPWSLRQKWFTKRIARWWYQDRILREAACLHVNSPQEAESIRKLGFKTPMAVIPVGVDLEEVDRRKSEIRNQKSEIQSSLSPELRGRPFILFLSRIHPKKGLDLLIRSWAMNRKSEIGNRESEDWMLVIAGSGEQPYIERCRRLAADLGIGKECLWTGHVDPVQKSWLFTHAHCYVLPTSGENFGNTVAEALAHGTPVITTRHTPWRDLEEHGCGWFVDNTETEISRALHEVFSLDAVARRKMGDAGERLVRDRYSLRTVSSDINAVYEWLSGGTSVPACVEFYQAGATFSKPFARLTGEEAETRFKKHAEVKLLFDQKAATWSRKYGPQGALRPRLHAFEKQLSELLKPPAAVLDFGCGTGDIARHLSACGYALSACDISHEMIAWAAKINPKASVTWELLQAGWQELPFAVNTFDAITASSVFEYLANIEIAFAALWRVLKPGGFLIATVPNSQHFARKLEKFLRPMATMAVKMPVLNRIQRLNSYATYLQCSRNCMPLDEWFAIGNRARFEVIAQDKSRASKTALVFLLFRKADNKSQQPLKNHQT